MKLFHHFGLFIEISQHFRWHYPLLWAMFDHLSTCVNLELNRTEVVQSTSHMLVHSRYQLGCALYTHSVSNRKHHLEGAGRTSRDVLMY